MEKYNRVRDSLGADWIFLSDPDRALLHELEMVDRTDSIIQPTDDIFLSSECSQKMMGTPENWRMRRHTSQPSI